MSIKNLHTKIQELTFIITKECNLNCSYCSQKHMKDIPDMKYFKKIISNFNKLKLFLDNFVYIDLFGGEPLLYQEFLKLLIQFLREEESKLNKKFKIRIFTNNLLLIEDFDFFIKHNIFFSISYDGLGGERGKINNVFFTNLKELQKNNLIDKIAFSVLNPKNDFLLKNYFYIAKHVENISKVTHYLIREPFLWTERGVNNYLREFDKFIDFAKIYNQEFNDYPLYIKSKKSFFGKNIYGCESGINRFTISNEILDCGVLNFENEFFSKNKNYIQLYNSICDTCEIKDDCDKKCPKYFYDYPELFQKTFCKIKKYEIKKIRSLYEK